MGEHRHGVHAVGQCLAVSVNVNAVSQSAHHDRVGYHGVQVPDESPYQVFTIACAVASAHDVYNVARVEVGRAFVEQHQRRVWGFFHPVGIAVIVEAQGLHAVVVGPSQFLFRAVARRRHVVDVGENTLGEPRKDGAKILPLLHYGGGGA